MIDQLEAWWIDNGLVFILGSLACTATGLLAMLLTRSPLHRQRWGEVTVAALLFWLLLAVIPVPRIEFVEPETVLPLNAGAAVVIEEFSTTAAMSAPHESPDLLLGIGAVLGLGSALAILYLALAAVFLLRLRLRAVPANAAIMNLARSLPLAPRRLRIVLSGDTQSPFCCGLVRPTVVLPLDAASRPAGELRAVLLHEFAHLAQGDLRGQSLFALAMPLCFWNPLFWYLRRQARLAAEVVADDLATRHFDRVTYVRRLIELAERASTPMSRHIAALGVLGGEGEFYRRMKMLIQRREPITSSCSFMQSMSRNLCALALSCCISLFWMSSGLVAQESEGQKQVKTEGPRFTAKLAYDGDEELGALVRKLVGSGLSFKKLDSEKGELTVELRARDQAEAIERVSKHAKVMSLSQHAAKKKAPWRQSGSSSGGESKAKSAAPRVYFAFEDHDVRKIIDTIAKISGANIVVSPEVQGTASVRLKGVSWRTALAVTVEPLGFEVTEVSDKIVRVAPRKSDK